MWSALVLALFLSEAPPKHYTIDLGGSTASTNKNGAGNLVVQIRAEPGFGVNPKAPLTMSLSAEHAKLKKSELEMSDAEDKSSHSPRFVVPFVAGDAGDDVIRGKITFFLCTETICERKTESLEHRLNVEP